MSPQVSQRWGGGVKKNFSLAPLAKLYPHLHNRCAAPGVTDHFLAETPVTDLYDKLRIDFYFPVLDVILARLRERFAGKNKVILDGVAALQFDATVM